MFDYEPGQNVLCIIEVLTFLKKGCYIACLRPYHIVSHTASQNLSQQDNARTYTRRHTPTMEVEGVSRLLPMSVCSIVVVCELSVRHVSWSMTSPRLRPVRWWPGAELRAGGLIGLCRCLAGPPEHPALRFVTTAAPSPIKSWGETVGGPSWLSGVLQPQKWAFNKNIST